MNSKLQSLFAYVGILWLVAFFAGRHQRDEFSRYHLKQGLGLWITSIALGFLIVYLLQASPILGLIVSFLSLMLLVLFLVGMYNVFNDKQSPLPFIGKWFEKGFIFLDKK
ncbi:MAG: hypothetical protein Q4G27_01330 [Flavobacteriaceae bacterium]|nr:hypothetical protein [Flavobacteriaceae bacterium]